MTYNLFALAATTILYMKISHRKNSVYCVFIRCSENMQFCKYILYVFWEFGICFALIFFFDIKLFVSARPVNDSFIVHFYLYRNNNIRCLESKQSSLKSSNLKITSLGESCSLIIILIFFYCSVTSDTVCAPPLIYLLIY